MSDSGLVPYDIATQRRFPSEARYCPLCAEAMAERTIAPDLSRRLTCNGCGFVHLPGPQLVAGCLVEENGRILLMRRGNTPERGRWTFPAGYVDYGETPVRTAIRECAEEVGLCVRSLGLLGLYADVRHPHAAVAVYLASVMAGRPQVSREAEEVRYFGSSEIPWQTLAFPSTRAALADWLAQKTENALKPLALPRLARA